ncbi:MAG: hypothetical protein ABIN95_13015 [Mucilaginibacter sp.]
MKTPEEDEILQADDSRDQNDEQMSQQDIHSNGFDDTADEVGEIDESDKLEQAYDAAEPSYTLNLDDDNDTGDDE